MIHDKRLITSTLLDFHGLGRAGPAIRRSSDGGESQSPRVPPPTPRSQRSRPRQRVRRHPDASRRLRQRGTGRRAGGENCGVAPSLGDGPAGHRHRGLPLARWGSRACTSPRTVVRFGSSGMCFDAVTRRLGGACRLAALFFCAAFFYRTYETNFSSPLQGTLPARGHCADRLCRGIRRLGQIRDRRTPAANPRPEPTRQRPPTTSRYPPHRCRATYP